MRSVSVKTCLQHFIINIIFLYVFIYFSSHICFKISMYSFLFRGKKLVYLLVSEARTQSEKTSNFGVHIFLLIVVDSSRFVFAFVDLFLFWFLGSIFV
jgi:hypothetical protein